MPICEECGEDANHTVHGMCRRCRRKQATAKYRSNHKEYHKEYRIANRDKIRDYYHRYHCARGGKPASENKQCPTFLGVHVAERILSKIFKDVKTMPPNHSGYDFICNTGKKIDVKSSCIITRDRQSDNWSFYIRKNQIADYFLCLAFDNREDLTPCTSG